MQLKTRSVVALALVLVFGVESVAWSGVFTPSADSATTAAVPGDEEHRNAPQLMIATTYSRKCATQYGTCTIDTPLPIGSSCTCPDGSAGRIVR